jgi:H+/Na+-translocating ferredoxin:NAD+ oxidoreductase subunit D
VSVDTTAIELRTSPHVKAELSTDVIMRHVTYALVPVCLFAVYAFGLSSLLLILVSTVSCVGTEALIARISKQRSTIADFSAVITGLLLGLTLPPGFPLWMAAVGGAIAIGMGKTLFGGLGYNAFNPALVGRAFLQASFPTAITTWTPAGVPGRFFQCIPSSLAGPFLQPPPIDDYIAGAAVDGWTGATPLMLMKAHLVGVGSDAYDALTAGGLFMGGVAGSAGETCAFIILLAGIYLVARKMMDWRIPVGMLLTVFVMSGAFHLSNVDKYPSPLFMLFSGGLVLGAVFMATDMVTSPTTPLGMWVFSILVGALTVIIRLKGGLPEGVMYAILLGNAATPIINNLTQPKIYGAKKAKAKT